MSKRKLRGFNFERLEDRRLLAADCGVEIIHCCNIQPVETCQMTSLEMEDGAIGELEEVVNETALEEGLVDETPRDDESGDTDSSMNNSDGEMDENDPGNVVVESIEATEGVDREVATTGEEQASEDPDIPPVNVDGVDTIEAETPTMLCDADATANEDENASDGESAEVGEDLNSAIEAEESTVSEDTIGDEECDIPGDIDHDHSDHEHTTIPPVFDEVVESSDPAHAECELDPHHESPFFDEVVAAEDVDGDVDLTEDEAIAETSETPDEPSSVEDWEGEAEIDNQELPASDSDTVPGEEATSEVVDSEFEMVSCEASVEPVAQPDPVENETVDENLDVIGEDITESVLEDDSEEQPPVDIGLDDTMTPDLETDCPVEEAANVEATEFAAEAEVLGDPVLGMPGYFGEINADNQSQDLMFTPSEDGTVDLVLATAFGDAETRLDVTDASGELVAATMTDDLNGFQRLTFDVDANETYLVTVSSDETGEGYFMLTVDFEMAPEPVPVDIHADVVGETATMLELNDGVVEVASELDTAVDSDAFRFVATSDGEMRLDMTTTSENYSSDAIVSVFDAEGELMVSGTTNEEVAIRFDTMSGVEYQVLVDSQNDVPAQYSLSGTLFADVADELDPDSEASMPSEETLVADLEFLIGNETELDDDEFSLVDDIFEAFGEDELVDTQFASGRTSRGRGPAILRS